MDRPETRYAKSGEVNIAYQVVGDGPFDLIWVPGWISNVEESWEVPEYAHFLRRLASFSRLILFDKRGTGLSDRVSNERLPTLEQRMDDVRAVLEAAGSERAAVFGASEGGNLSILFAATYPERVRALVLLAAYAKRVWSPDYPWAPTAEERERENELLEREWGGEMDVSELAPGAADDPVLMRRIATFFRRSASPGAAVALNRMNTDIDTRAALPTISAPTLVLHRVGDLNVKVDEGRWIAGQIPAARYVELPGDDHLAWTGDTDTLLDEVEEFLTGIRRAPSPDRVLATVLFTDIVGSTDQVAQLGDRRWRELLDDHHRVVRRELERYRGREIDTAGDGFLSTFDGPARAIRCARAISDSVRTLGLEIRAGLHTGECELVGNRIAGIAVHTAARIMSLAGPGEILVSNTVKDLVAGSGIEFDARGDHELKGVPGRWQLYAASPGR
ncbi:MAG TPA: adenylate/guanylate cyclase domain-containing protein [Gaiellaceae bacterium]|nr:adenylate/guanylate cyclase domain-containing protein [Gaiellaceae bacterium]